MNGVSSRCNHCGGALYMDDDGPRCLNCSRPLYKIEPLPIVGRTAFNRKDSRAIAGVKPVVGNKPVYSYLPTVETVRARKRRAR